MQEQEYENENGIKEKTNEGLPEGIGERIAWLRRSEGMTQAQLAEKLGISAQAVSKWESGQSCPDIMMLLPLAGIFDVSTDMLLGAAVMNIRDIEESQSAAEDAAKMMGIVAKAIDDESSAERSKRPRDPEWSGEPEREQERKPDREQGSEQNPEQNLEQNPEQNEEQGREPGLEQSSKQDGEPEREKRKLQFADDETEDRKEDSFRKTGGAESERADAYRQERTQKKPVHAPKEKIRSLRLDLGAAEAFIREGDAFSLKMMGYDDVDFTSVVTEDGVWKISDGGYRAAILGFRGLFRGRKAIITIPADYRFRSVHLSMGAGTITGESISTKECVLNVGAGQMTLLNFDCEGADMKCGMGEIKIEGKMTGRCRVDCGMGSVTANLAPLEDYGYDLSVGMGDVKIGEDGFSGMSGKHRMNRNAENFFKVTCGMGAVNIRFKYR